MTREATLETGTNSAELRGIRKTFISKGRAVHAVDDVNLGIKKGEYIVILGPSGCGKSTLLRCIAGLETPTEGSISLQNRPVYDAEQRIDVKPNARNVGMVFQNYALWPHMTVERNVAYPLRMRKVPKAQWGERVAEVLKALECEAYAKRLPAELSGGQQQRISLARALVYQPDILLLDEPLSNLDALLRVSLRSELMRLHRELGFTALHITHDQEEALEMGDRVVLMREGRIEQIGRPEDVYARPVSPYAAHFLGVRNQAEVSVGSGGLSGAVGTIRGSGALIADMREDETLKLFLRGRDTEVLRRTGATDVPRPGHLEIDGVLAQIVLGEGGRRQYVIDLNGEQWFAQHALDEGLQPGDDVTVSAPATSALLYREETLVYPPANATEGAAARVGA